MAKDLVVPEIDERTRNQVIRYLGTKTVRQIAEAVGVAPEVVLRVKQDIVDSLDALTAEEYVAKAFVDLQTITSMAMEKFHEIEDERALSGLLTNATGSIKTTLQMLEKWQSKNQANIDTVNRKRQQELVTLVHSAFGKFVEFLEQEKGLEPEEMWNTFEGLMYIAAQEMEARNE